ncbi:hypothetical protein ANTPLA_LOCUS2580 [Anthophora plagiata]
MEDSKLTKLKNLSKRSYTKPSIEPTSPTSGHVSVIKAVREMVVSYRFTGAPVGKLWPARTRIVLDAMRKSCF